jgi:hypothetical protein
MQRVLPMAIVHQSTAWQGTWYRTGFSRCPGWNHWRHLDEIVVGTMKYATRSVRPTPLNQSQSASGAALTLY